MGFLGSVTCVLVAAKLFGYQHYGWLVALSPELIGGGLLIVVTLLEQVLRGLRS